MISTTSILITCLISGYVILVNCCQVVAPSILAASNRLSGMDFMAASCMTIWYPTYFHITTIMRASITVFSSLSHACLRPLRRIRSRNVLRRPNSELYIILNRSPTPAPQITEGRKNTD